MPTSVKAAKRAPAKSSKKVIRTKSKVATTKHPPAKKSAPVAIVTRAPITDPRDGVSMHLLIHNASQIMAEVFSGHLPVGVDMTIQQYEVMRVIESFDKLGKKPSQTDLVNTTNIDRSTLAEIVRRLEQRGQIARQRRVEDSRAYALDLTSDGRNALKHGEVALKAVGDMASEVPGRDAALSWCEEMFNRNRDKGRQLNAEKKINALIKSRKEAETV